MRKSVTVSDLTRAEHRGRIGSSRYCRSGRRIARHSSARKRCNNPRMSYKFIDPEEFGMPIPYGDDSREALWSLCGTAC